MAPIRAAATGITPQVLEDPILRDLLSVLKGFSQTFTSPQDLHNLADLLEPYATKWPFEEQVDLYEWIHPLNVMDSALTWILNEHGRNLLLLHKEETKHATTLDQIITTATTGENPSIIQNGIAILNFTAILLRNATSKHLYNSVELVGDFLAAASDALADAALFVLEQLSLPLPLHRQPHPPPHESGAQVTLEAVLDKLIVLTKGYGTAATGMGLDWAVETDDSQPLPPSVGQVEFGYYVKDELHFLHLNVNENKGFKRRKVDKAMVKSTAELYFFGVSQSQELTNKFALLGDIRLARAAHSQDTRCTAVCRRLRALAAILYTHPEVLNGYFQAQPELGNELVDLLRPMIRDVHARPRDGGAWQVDIWASGAGPNPAVRLLALQTLTALVNRRDSSRLSSSVLAELGVGKGQYLGVLPTLLRYALAALDKPKTNTKAVAPIPTDPAIAVGLAFVEAVQEEPVEDDGLEFVDQVLALAGAVVGSPSGTSALVDCGLLPTLLTIIATETDGARFVTAQAVQILEAAIVTHTNALAAFKDLQGVQVLLNRMTREMKGTSYSHRVLLFSILTSLTVVLHQDTTAGSHLREMAEPLKQFLNLTYGGHLAALTCTLIADVTNNDPHVSQVVQHVHSSGLAEAFLNMLRQPHLPPVPELIMALPNVLFALALTEDGANIVADANPFPHLLKLFHTAEYAMPKSRCLLNEMASTVGTGLDDIMRNVERLKSIVLKALVDATDSVADFGESLVAREDVGTPSSDMENDRSCLIQYVLNFGQLLEQVLQHEDHCEIFVEAGGLDALLRMSLVSMPSGMQFLSFVSSLSCPSVCSLHHGTTEESLSSVVKNVLFRYDPRKMLQKLTAFAAKLLDDFDESERQVGGPSLDSFPLETLYQVSDSGRLGSISTYLHCVANVHWVTQLLANAVKVGCQRSGEAGTVWNRSERGFLEELSSDNFTSLVGRLSKFHRESLLEVCRARTAEGFDIRERQRLVARNKRLRYRLRIVCSEGAVVRDGIEIDSCANVGSLEMGDIVDADDRCINSSGILRYRTHRGWLSEMTRGHGREPIAEVVRLWQDDSDEIDEDPEVSTKMRIETGISDLRSVAINVLARGQTGYSDLIGNLSKLVIHGTRHLPSPATFEKGDVGYSIGSVLRIVRVNVCDAMNCVLDEVRGSLSGAARSRGAVGGGVAMYLGCMLSLLHVCLFDEKRERRMVNFPLLMSLIAFDPYVDFIASEEDAASYEVSSVGFCDAVRCVLEHGLSDFPLREQNAGSDDFDYQRVGRSVAASLPPLILLLRKLASTPLSSSPTATIMSRMNRDDLSRFLSKNELNLEFTGSSKDEEFFHPESFTADLQRTLSSITKEVWSDKRLIHVPPFLVHPLAGLVGEIVMTLEELAKKKTSKDLSRAPERIRLSDLVMRRRAARDENAEDEEAFEASEDTITRLMEMGFNRDHALDAIESTRSNRIETVMDYALTSGPPSAAEIERRRADREERARRRAERAENNGDQEPAEANPAEGAIETGEADEETGVDAMDEDDGPAAASESAMNTNKENIEILNSAAKADLDSWVKLIPQVSCQLLRRMPPPSLLRTKQSLGRLNGAIEVKIEDGDGESEALTVILSSFMLDLCSKYPEQQSTIVNLVLRNLKESLSCSSTDSAHIETADEASVAALCHAAVLITRALPKSRLLVLKEGVVRALVACLQTFIGSWSHAESNLPFSLWLTPALLLLDIMARPVVAFSDDDAVKALFADSPDIELTEVQSEHKEQAAELLQMANVWFKGSGDSSSETKKVATGEAEGIADDNTRNEMQVDDEKPESKAPERQLASIPAFFPLLTAESSKLCLDICLSLLGCDGRCKEISLPPGVAQSVLLLLLRLLRSPKTATSCVHAGVAECILALPMSSKFIGNSGLVTLIFRRLLEDESTLQSAMETEVRAAVTKLKAQKASSTGTANEDNSRVTLAAFFEASTPLLCRNPAAFLKATAVSVAVRVSNGDDAKVELLSPSERTARIEFLNKLDKPDALVGTPRLETKKADSSLSKKAPNGSKPKAKLKRAFSSSSKKSKKDKVSDPPAVHITGLLMNTILASSTGDAQRDDDDDKEFLWKGDLLEILADLMLAVPACASAVHNFRLKSKEKASKDKARRSSLGLHVRNALSGCPAPPKSFANFLLHSLLPRDRWSAKGDPQIWDRRRDFPDDDAAQIKLKKKRIQRLVKVSHGAARVLLALVLRPGESRKRLVADLAFALSGGLVAHGEMPSQTPTVQNGVESNASELHALQSWAELCLGIVAPRTTGKNYDTVSSLNMENIKLLLESGMAQALLYGLKRATLCHPMASSACGLLLIPFEIMTRSSVADAIAALSSKENGSSDAAKGSGGSSSDGVDVLERECDAMVVDDVHNDIESHNSIDDGPIAAAYEALVDAEEIDMEDEGSHDDHIADAGLESPSDASEETDGAEDSETDEMDEDDDSEIDDSDESSDGGEEDEDGAWDLQYHDPFVQEGPVAQHEQADDVEDMSDATEQNAEGGWTRIYSNGLGGMFMEARRGDASAGEDPTTERTRGFIDAAEAMIGTLLRNGDISGEALAEIEGTLGMRLMPGGRAFGAALRPATGLADSFGAHGAFGMDVRGVDIRPRNTRGDFDGTVPHVHQRSQPEVGHSAFGRSGQWVEISPMEIVFGGPSLTGGNSNYDVISIPRHEDDFDDILTPNQLDLFPGGPAAAVRSRTQQVTHPLLTGVVLPPINSLLSDLLPHGSRASGSGQMTTRRTGDWTNALNSTSRGYFSSTSNGNLLRSNRPHAALAFGGTLTNRNAASLAGWIDDGVAADGFVDTFSSALRNALVENARAEQNDAAPAEAPAEDEEANNVETTQGNSSPGDAAADNGDAEPERASDSSETGLLGLTSSLAVGLRNSLSESDGPAEEPERVDDNDGLAQESTTGDSMPDSNHAAVNPAAEESDDGDTDATSEGAVASTARNATSDTNEALDAAPTAAENALPSQQGDDSGAPFDDESALVCPPGFDVDVFNSLPREMQQDCVTQYNATQELATQLHGSSLDPEVLAELPEDMRREVIEQDRRQRQSQEQEQAQADPSQAQEMDNASIIASMAPELREEILMTIDENVLNTLPPEIRAEAQILRDRASVQQRRVYDGALGSAPAVGGAAPNAATQPSPAAAANAESAAASALRRRQKSGKVKVEADREMIVPLSGSASSPVAASDLQALVRLLFLITPVRPSRILQRVFLNLSGNPVLRSILFTVMIRLLNEDGTGTAKAVDSFKREYQESDVWRRTVDGIFYQSENFPPRSLLGAATEVSTIETFNLGPSSSLLRQRQSLGTAASTAASLPMAGDSSRFTIPPVVASRILDTMVQLCRSPKLCLHTLAGHLTAEDGETPASCFEKLLELLDRPMYTKSATNLELLLTLLESSVLFLSNIPRNEGDESEVSQRDVDHADASGKEYVDIPRVVVSPAQLQMLCGILRLETCRDAGFAKVNTIVRRLCRVEANRGCVLAELATVAHGLGVDAYRDLRALRIRMERAVFDHQAQSSQSMDAGDEKAAELGPAVVGSISSSVALSTSSSELKLLRVLQTLQALCNENYEETSARKTDSMIFTEELVHLLRQMQFDDFWDELSKCLKVVQVLEGVKTFEEDEDEAKAAEEAEINDEASGDDTAQKTKKLRNSAAGLLTRFLPSVEAFFVANASFTRSTDGSKEEGKYEVTLENMVDGQRVLEFVTTNKVLLNALVRNNSSLLDKGLRALVQIPRFRPLLDFDVKRQWFKTQVRRLRQQASRRYGSLRLHIRRDNVFQDAYFQLQPRNADEMRGRLHVTFRDEQGVDAGGLSREFFGILAKEMFNPNYALFTSTEDGCTFQPNPNSAINPDHLSYFRFVGRVVGKAVSDGYLLDAHFTRSLYKHMLGMEPTHHDMEAIDPDYYGNLRAILENNLEDMGLDDLTFSIEDHSFGRSQVIDLVPNGRSVKVTDETKEEYVRKVCQHRMTTSIQNQIKSYLDGFYELVSPELVAIFTPRELELLISGLPDIDIYDLKANTEYNGWRSTDKEIGWFWNIMFSLTRNEKAAFLQFVTGSSKVPLAGFSELQGMRGTQKFSIHKMGGRKGALMSAHTCFNSLDLPAYDTEEQMREKLLYAINEGAGSFGFA